VSRPQRSKRVCEFSGRIEFTAKCSVSANKLSIAKLTNSIGAIDFSTRPKIATRKSAKYRGPPGSEAFALSGVKNFFNAIGHD
jgi:hypothetical protein